MTLSQCKQNMTERELAGWVRWLDDEWNTPTRTDHYLMQIAQEVRRVLRKNPNKIKLKQFAIEFVKQQEGQPIRPRWSKEHATAVAKARLSVILSAHNVSPIETLPAEAEIVE